MNLTIRQEEQADQSRVNEVVEAAFKTATFSDQTEHLLVQRLRQSTAFVPQLSLVAELEKNIVGHVLLTKIVIKEAQKSFPSLALAPVSVHPDFQRKGIGGQLIIAAHQVAKTLGFTSVVLLGYENYYPRFGYQKASDFKIALPFPAPDENCMAIELVEGALSEISGVVEYSKAFYE